MVGFNVLWRYGHQLVVATALHCTSLIPRPPPFLPFFCVHYNTRERRTSEKQGRPGSIHHVSGREVDVGGEGPIFKYARTKLESEFLTGQDR